MAGRKFQCTLKASNSISNLCNANTSVKPLLSVYCCNSRRHYRSIEITPAQVCFTTSVDFKTHSKSQSNHIINIKSIPTGLKANIYDLFEPATHLKKTPGPKKKNVIK